MERLSGGADESVAEALFSVWLYFYASNSGIWKKRKVYLFKFVSLTFKINTYV